jgi:hypothetical protein
VEDGPCQTTWFYAELSAVSEGVAGDRAGAG